MNKFILLTALFIISLAVFVLFFRDIKNQDSATPSPTASPQVQQDNSPFEVIAQNLEVPWALAFLPDNSILVTERKGLVKLVKDNTAIEIANVKVNQTGESGLHGIAIDPNFNQNHFIFLYYTYSDEGQNSLNRVSRFTFENNKLNDEKIIVDQIPGATIHDGGRIKFGPDGNLYITTGDAANPSLSQDKNSKAGKILRVVNEKVEVYSYGHRNPQGITWDDQGRLWEVEHGQSATDEINQLVMGRNYGWPTIRGNQKQDGLEPPVLHSDLNTWAPGGAAFLNGSIFFAGLRGQALFEYNIQTQQLKEHFKNQFGRIREVISGPDNMFYITTSNLDGRGNPKEGDDKIIRVNPNKLQEK